MTVTGQDWASYQSGTPATTGLDFVFIKVTEGTDYTNPKWLEQRDHARAAGLVVGYYHYAQGVKNLAEADYFLSKVTLAPGELLAFDWEDSDVSNAEKDAWLKYVQAKVPAHRVVLYCNRSYWLDRDSTSYCADGLWIADPSAPAGHPRVQHTWTFHQYSEAGGVDRNVGNFASRAALQTWAAKGAKPPAPKPKPKPAVHYAPYPGTSWFRTGRKSPIVAVMHKRLVQIGCNHYTSSKNTDVIGSGDEASYEAYQRKYSAQHHKGWTGNALKWPPGKETWDALQVPKP